METEAAVVLLRFTLWEGWLEGGFPPNPPPTAHRTSPECRDPVVLQVPHLLR
jgi:hypothetical protein